MQLLQDFGGLATHRQGRMLCQHSPLGGLNRHDSPRIKCFIDGRTVALTVLPFLIW
jgi:hypothetical protein